jgi:hypothetical protein
MYIHSVINLRSVHRDNFISDELFCKRGRAMGRYMNVSPIFGNIENMEPHVVGNNLENCYVRGLHGSTFFSFI